MAAHLSSPRVAQGDVPSDADLLFRAMTREGRNNAALSDNEKIDRALKEAAADAQRKKLKLRQAAKFWRDPFSPDPDRLLPVQVRPPAPVMDADPNAAARRELAKAREETAIARAQAAAAKAEAARANAARARAEANAAYVTAVAAKKEAEAARASCEETRFAKLPSASPRPYSSKAREASHAGAEGLVTASHREDGSPRRTADRDDARTRTLTQADAPSPATGGVGGEGNGTRGWRNGIVVVPMSSGR